MSVEAPKRNPAMSPKLVKNVQNLKEILNVSFTVKFDTRGLFHSDVRKNLMHYSCPNQKKVPYTVEKWIFSRYFEAAENRLTPFYFFPSSASKKPSGKWSGKVFESAVVA